MSLILRPDDIEAGTLLTVLKAAPMRQITPYGELVERDDQRMTGVPLKVVALSPPYFAGELLTGPSVGHCIIMDMRQHEFCKVTPEYAAALDPCERAKPVVTVTNAGASSFTKLADFGGSG